MTTSTSSMLAVLLGAGFGAGVWLLTAGLRPRATSRGWWWSRRATTSRPRHPGVGMWRGLLALAAGVVAGVGTGWVVAAVAAVALVWVAPRLVSGAGQQRRAVARIEAIATWTEMLRDTLSAAAGLEQAVLATADVAPEAIQAEVSALAARLADGATLAEAVREFAREVDDPLGDLVAAALLVAAEQQARQLTTLLGELATAARERVAMRRRVETGRARIRSGVRVIVGTATVFAVGLVTLNRPFLAPYDSATGQVVLAVVVALFGVSFGWRSRMSRFADPGRILTVGERGRAREEVRAS